MRAFLNSYQGIPATVMCMLAANRRNKCSNSPYSQGREGRGSAKRFYALEIGPIPNPNKKTWRKFKMQLPRVLAMIRNR